jgi:hypothetical protein
MNRSAEHPLGTLKTRWPRAERVLGAPTSVQGFKARSFYSANSLPESAEE